jgi:hypothetical protein
MRVTLHQLKPTVGSLLDHPLFEGITVLQTSRFYPCPSGRDHFKAVRGNDISKFSLSLCIENLWSTLENS